MKRTIIVILSTIIILTLIILFLNLQKLKPETPVTYNVDNTKSKYKVDTSSDINNYDFKPELFTTLSEVKDYKQINRDTIDSEMESLCFPTTYTYKMLSYDTDMNIICVKDCMPNLMYNNSTQECYVPMDINLYVLHSGFVFTEDMYTKLSRIINPKRIEFHVVEVLDSDGNNLTLREGDTKKIYKVSLENGTIKTEE